MLGFLALAVVPLLVAVMFAAGRHFPGFAISAGLSVIAVGLNGLSLLAAAPAVLLAYIAQDFSPAARQLLTTLSFAIVLVGLYAVLFLSFPQPPSILAGMPNDIREVGPQLTARLQARFPEGTPEEHVMEALAAEAFDTEPGSARFATVQFVCPNTWVINWTAVDGRVTEIKGHLGVSFRCLL